MSCCIGTSCTKRRNFWLCFWYIW